jgi:hypothetical protein
VLLNGLKLPRPVPSGCCIGIELPGMTRVVATVKEFSALYPKGSDYEGLGVIGVTIAAWLTTALPAGIVGT